MANPLIQNRTHAAEVAALSLAGIRPFLTGVVAVSAGSESTYTIADNRTNRVVLFYDGTTNLDIRVELEETADANSFPIAPGVYFSIQAVENEVVHLYNTTGAGINVYVVEIL